MLILNSLKPIETTTITDQVFYSVYNAILTLEIKPGDKVSEAEISKRLEVSRQPVRDAFYRLSKLSLLNIRPQKATTISYISEQAVLDSIFIRTALEVETLRTCISKVTDADIELLGAVLSAQHQAAKVDKRLEFQNLDDEFHQTICKIAGHPDIWSLIKDQKIHMDRLRYLSLEKGAHKAHEEHSDIFDFIKTRDIYGAEIALRAHLSGLYTLLETVKASHPEFFESNTIKIKSVKA